ncbi:hypothetical protein QYM36_007596 [Artemia franciscana]|uniref:Protein kinase domain-containing protein n=1 Tax=Artemia franciscana TaxID=6661 RepID=A0AA88IEE9_ARTSF|nr:hypothetical protein QYM36_007596 [Artemia franciscana]
MRYAYSTLGFFGTHTLAIFLSKNGIRVSDICNGIDTALYYSYVTLKALCIICLNDESSNDGTSTNAIISKSLTSSSLSSSGVSAKSQSPLDSSGSASIRLSATKSKLKSSSQANELKAEDENGIFDLLVSLKPQYDLLSLLGKGCFGEVYSLRDRTTGKLVAIKIIQKSPKRKNRAMDNLRKESTILKELSGKKGIPKFFYFNYNENIAYMILELLGPSLDKFLGDRTNPTSLKYSIVKRFASTLIEALRALHDLGYLHMDLKPENTAVQFEENSKEPLLDKNRLENASFFLIDFGLSKKYINDGEHHKQIVTNHFEGNKKYASINAHLRSTQGRGDDLESFGYVLIFLTLGKLPWSYLGRFKDKDEHEKKVIKTKIKLKNDKSLWKNTLENYPELYLYMKNIYELEFTQKPDYEYLKKLFQS